MENADLSKTDLGIIHGALLWSSENAFFGRDAEERLIQATGYGSSTLFRLAETLSANAWNMQSREFVAPMAVRDLMKMFAHAGGVVESEIPSLMLKCLSLLDEGVSDPDLAVLFGVGRADVARLLVTFDG